jgi:glutaredoxin
MIKLYSKTVCPKCIVAKSFFEGSDIKFQMVNIDQDVVAKDKLTEAGFMSVPIVEFNGKFYTNIGEFQELVNDLK